MATKLIAILERCGIRQRDIAQQLGVSRATVSRWASGERRMTSGQHARLLEWAQRAAVAARDEARARDAAAPGPPTILGANRYTDRLDYDLRELWHDYTWEIQPTALNAVALAILQRWGAYSQDLTPATFDLKPDDENRLWEETRQLRGWLATRRRLREASPAEEPDDVP